eukprot:scaffold56081_cov27-Tisochrysis_lutea.AAC.1
MRATRDVRQWLETISRSQQVKRPPLSWISEMSRAAVASGNATTKKSDARNHNHSRKSYYLRSKTKM